MKTKYNRFVAGVVVAATAALLGKGVVTAATNGTTETVNTSQHKAVNSTKSVTVQIHSIAQAKKQGADVKSSSKTASKQVAATTKTSTKTAAKVKVSSSSSKQKAAASSKSSAKVATSSSQAASTTASHAQASATSSHRASSARSATTSRSASRPVVRTVHRTVTARPAVRRNTISFAGVTMTVLRGSMSATTAPAGNVAQTWGGQTRLSVTDGQSTHIIGHNTSSFGRITSLGVGSGVKVVDGNGNTRTYHVYSVKNVTDQGYVQGTRTNVYNRIVSASQGEQVVLQTCLSQTVNRIVWAR